MNIEQWASEEKLTEALAELMEKCNEFQIDLLLIGAFAVRVYTPKRHRRTTDLDFVIPKTAQNSLATVFKLLGYTYNPRARFGGVQAVKEVKSGIIQVDVSVEVIHDMGSGSEYAVPPQTFQQKTPVQIAPVEGDSIVDAFAIPLSDLLITKLITSREQDISDLVALLTAGEIEAVIDDFKTKAYAAGVAVRINKRLGELVVLSRKENAVRELIKNYTGPRLTIADIQNFRQMLRKLEI